MNIVTPFPTTPVLNTSNVNTEAARRDNILRETIPQSSANESGEPERGLGSEGDRARQATGQFSSPLVYERPTLQNNNSEQSAQAQGDAETPDNGSDESAGRESAEQEQRDQAKVRELQQRDQEVRAHEQAHASVGGQYAGAPQYEFETGPDGRQYAVGGEVSIDISEESTPEATLRKMQQVRAAALAPAEPSPQDLRVAAEASRKASEAQSDLVEEAGETIRNPDGSENTEDGTPSLDDIVSGGPVSAPTRVLDNVNLDEERENEVNAILAQRNTVISSFYNNAVSAPPSGFSAIA